MTQTSSIPPSGGRYFEVAARTSRIWASICLWSAGGLFAVAVAVLAVNIVMRYVFDEPLDVQEATIIAFIYVTFLGGAALYARNEDVALTILVDVLPERGRAAWTLLVYLAIAATCWVIGANTLILARAFANLPTPSLGVPQAVQVWPFAIWAWSTVFFSLVEAWACTIWLVTGNRPIVFAPTDPAV